MDYPENLGISLVRSIGDYIRLRIELGSLLLRTSLLKPGQHFDVDKVANVIRLTVDGNLYEITEEEFGTDPIRAFAAKMGTPTE